MNTYLKIFLLVSLSLTGSIAKEQKPTQPIDYVKIKSEILDNERAYLLYKREKLATTVANRNSLYISNILDLKREANRPTR